MEEVIIQVRYKGFKEYKVSNLGYMLGKYNKKISAYIQNGNLYINLINRKTKNRLNKPLHSIVYEHFIGELPEYYKITHKDNNISNCCIDNLILVEYHKPATKEQIDSFLKYGIEFIEKYCKKHYYYCYKWGGDLDNIIGEAILKAYQNLSHFNCGKKIWYAYARCCKNAYKKEYTQRKRFGLAITNDIIDYVKRKNYYD